MLTPHDYIIHIHFNFQSSHDLNSPVMFNKHLLMLKTKPINFVVLQN